MGNITSSTAPFCKRGRNSPFSSSNASGDCWGEKGYRGRRERSRSHCPWKAESRPDNLHYLILRRQRQRSIQMPVQNAHNPIPGKKGEARTGRVIEFFFNCSDCPLLLKKASFLYSRCGESDPRPSEGLGKVRA